MSRGVCLIVGIWAFNGVYLFWAEGTGLWVGLGIWDCNDFELSLTSGFESNLLA